MSYYNLLSTHIKTGQPTKTQATFVYVLCSDRDAVSFDFSTVVMPSADSVISQHAFCAAQWTLASSRHKHIRHSVVKRGRSVTYDLSRHLAVASFLTLSCFFV